MEQATPRLAILRRALAPQEGTPGGSNDRLRGLLDAFEALDARPTLVTFAEEDLEDARARLSSADCVLVFVDPINPPDGRDRSQLDPLLREIAAQGVTVSTHPDVILKMGTKDVLFTTRDMGWGSDTRLYESPQQLRKEFPEALIAGPRVLKQHRGNGGNGVWKVELTESARAADSPPASTTVVRVLHAIRGSLEEDLALGEFFDRCQSYFDDGAPLIDQPYGARLADGQVRVYLVEDTVVGFGRQRVAALMPAPAGSVAPEPEPRYYFPPQLPDLQGLRSLMESEWVPEMQRALGIDKQSLPLLWDADFLYGPPGPDGQDTFVLCEINVSSVIPFPPSASLPLATATVARAAHASGRSGAV